MALVVVALSGNTVKTKDKMSVWSRGEEQEATGTATGRYARVLNLNCSLIKKAEHPQRDACAIAGFDAVNGQVAVGDAGKLIDEESLLVY